MTASPPSSAETVRVAARSPNTAFWANDWWKSWVGRFWFARGIAAAIAVANLVPLFVDLSRFQVLRAFHALIYGWRAVATSLGEFLGQLPWVPVIEANEISALLFVLAVGLPSAFGLVAMHRWLYEETTALSRVFVWSGVSLLAVCVPFMSYVAYMGVADEEYSRQLGSDAWLFALTTQAWFLAALVFLRGYARGALIVVTFVATLEGLYWLNTPWVADAVNAFANSQLR